MRSDAGLCIPLLQELHKLVRQPQIPDHRAAQVLVPDVPRADAEFRVKGRENVYVAGQLSGVEGYMESAMSGMIAGLSAAARLAGRTFEPLPETTIMGALTRYISAENEDFQPMNANFGILPPLEARIRDKLARKTAYAERAVKDMSAYAARYERA